MRLCIDCGHGGSDPGSIGRQPRTVREKDVVLAIGQRVAESAARRGWEPLMTRLQDRTLSLASRAAFANRLHADLFVSLHANAAASPDVEGIEVYHFPGSAPGRWLALNVLERLLVRFPDHRARGVKEANFAVLRRTGMPGVLVETEFLTCPRQLDFLSDAGNQAALAEAIVDGLAAASGIPFQELLPLPVGKG
jgi:N-acetylmuramoyl-L-alanine amidase